MPIDSIAETGSFEALDAFELVELVELVESFESLELMRPPRARVLEARE